MFAAAPFASLGFLRARPEIDFSFAVDDKAVVNRTDGAARCSNESREMNTGFLFIRHNTETVAVLARAMTSLSLPHRTGDKTSQGAVNHAIKLHSASALAGKVRKLRLDNFPCDVVANGWNAFQHPDLTRNAVAIHANWMVSSSTKEHCFREGQACGRALTRPSVEPSAARPNVGRRCGSYTALCMACPS